jgi:hypothetical protein
MKKIILSALVAASLVGATSCKDFLTETPISNVGPAQVTNANTYVNGALNTLVSDNMFRYGQFPNLWDYDSDDSSGATWAFGDIGAGNFQNYWGIDTGWSGPYVLIHRCNFGISQVAGMTMDATAQRDAIAQLKVLRAWSYFQLVRAYGAVPLLEKSVAEGTAPQQAAPP